MAKPLYAGQFRKTKSEDKEPSLTPNRSLLKSSSNTRKYRESLLHWNSGIDQLLCDMEEGQAV